MRIGQLARKLNVRPAEVASFFAQGEINPEGNLYNTRLSDEQVKNVIRFFAPDRWHELFTEALAEDNLPQPNEEVPSPSEGNKEDVNTNAEGLSDKTQPQFPEEKNDIIKAPKIELPGLKVVGKIDLPEKKPRPAEAAVEGGTEPAGEKKRLSGKQEWTVKLKRRQGFKNPIALAREREQRELEKQKRTKAEQEKQARKKRYEQKVAGNKKPKAEKPVVERPAIHPVVSQQSSPSAWQRFKKWLFRE